MRLPMSPETDESPPGSISVRVTHPSVTQDRTVEDGVGLAPQKSRGAVQGESPRRERAMRKGIRDSVLPGNASV